MKICSIVNQKNYIERLKARPRPFRTALRLRLRFAPLRMIKKAKRFGVVHSHSIVLGGLVEMS